MNAATCHKVLENVPCLYGNPAPNCLPACQILCGVNSIGICVQAFVNSRWACAVNFMQLIVPNLKLVDTLLFRPNKQLK